MQDRPGPSTDRRPWLPEEIAARQITEAENAKTDLYPLPGKHAIHTKFRQGDYVNTAMINEDYIIVSGHVDENMLEKIQKGEYVDFGKLIPRDRVLMEEENRYEMVIKGGHSYYVLVSESSALPNFSRWEQAFRVYSNVYLKARSTELIEYNHVIHTILLSYSWDNVYMYDKDFHIHMSKHPECN